jgi:TonB dependent receptor/CarboxypepD_reg-like domain/TonB-dependent Receptor Plug Domain
MKILLLTTLVACTLSVSFGQGAITGNVFDSNTHERLIGASIAVVDYNSNAIADAFGNFTIKNLPPGRYTIAISFVGYSLDTREVIIENNQTTFLTVGLVPGDVQLADVTVTAAGQSDLNTLAPIDIRLRPVNNSQDILRMVPGLFIAQHAGGGKAEQIFLRGFDIDHGTDINLEVDGLPVNMVSHAHGQGYSDLHFVIPELIQYVDFNKGPYYANKGDFATAGYVDFQTKSFLEENFVKLEGGQFGSVRGVAGVNIANPDSKTWGLVASEFFRTDGYVESPQHFNRLNISTKLSHRYVNDDVLTGGLTFFKSRWDASGQIPSRAVDAGLITRWGSIDDTEGGETMRVNLFFKHEHKFKNAAYLQQQIYGTLYDFNLYSNFTFFLNDPIRGDQIQQAESRTIYGYKGSYFQSGTMLGKMLTTEAGLGVRADDVDDIRLSKTSKRNFIQDLKRGDLNELNVNIYVNETLHLNDKIMLNAGVRLDYFKFRYNDKLISTDKSVGKAIASPKVNLTYQITSRTQLYLRSGIGFHSNDTRVVTEQNGTDILPRAYGFDLGANSKITDRLLINIAAWHLDLQQEFVYVGDEGIVEPSGKTSRAGIDLSARFQLLDWLYLDSDINYTYPRATDREYIPLAPIISSIGGLTYRCKNGINGSIRYRYLGDRPANEDYSTVAKGYFLSDAILNYTRKNYEIGILLENIFNVKWNEAQFETESRLENEIEPVSEIHFTPGTPLLGKIRLTVLF